MRMQRNPTGGWEGYELESKAPVGFWASYLPALRVPAYAYYFSGYIVSIIGTWMQIVAQGWLVYELTSSGSYLGLISFCSAVPMILLSLAGGNLADRFSKRNLLLITNSVFCVLAIALAALTLTHVVTVHMIMVIAICGGIVSALDAPTRQSMVVELVGPEIVANAVALNSILFNTARVIGPSIAGVILARYSAGHCFAINAASFLAAIYALSRIHNTGVSVRTEDRQNSKAGGLWGYVMEEPAITSLLLLIAASSLLGMAWMGLMPLVANRMLGLSAGGYAAMMSSIGSGALGGGLLIVIRKGKGANGRSVVIGVALMILGLFGVALSRSVYTAVPSVIAIGFGSVLSIASVNTLLQRRARPDMRGRIFALYAIGVMGMMPLGSLGLGALVDRFPVNYVMMGSGFAIGVVIIISWIRYPKIISLS